MQTKSFLLISLFCALVFGVHFSLFSKDGLEEGNTSPSLCAVFQKTLEDPLVYAPPAVATIGTMSVVGNFLEKGDIGPLGLMTGLLFSACLNPCGEISRRKVATMTLTPIVLYGCGCAYAFAKSYFSEKENLSFSDREE